MYPVECVVRGYLSGSGWSEYRESGAVCGIALPAACGSPIAFPSRSSRPRQRPRSVTTTRTSTSSAPPRSSATARSWRSCGGSRSSCTSMLLRTPRRAASSSPTRSSSSAPRQGPRWCSATRSSRRTPRASGRPTSTSPAGRSALRQAVSARLARRDRLGPHPAGAGASRRGGRQHAGEVPRGLRADHRRGPRLDGRRPDRSFPPRRVDW